MNLISFFTFWKKKPSRSLGEMYFGKRYADFLSTHGFSLVKDVEYDDENVSASMTIVKNPEMQMAFSVKRGSGEGIYVAPVEAPADPKSVIYRERGWSMAPEIWNEMNKGLVAEWEKHDWPERPNEERLRELIEISLFEFMQRLHSGEFDIRHPKFRLEDDPDETEAQRMMREQNARIE